VAEIDRQALARRIYSASYITGRFRLRSGAFSDEYFDKYLFESDPALLWDIAQAVSSLIPSGVDALAGLEMGGIPIATVLSQITGIPALFIRKKPKEYGTCKLAEGGEVAGRRLVIIEDVVTTAGQVRESAKALRERGADIVRVVCVIDREAGGADKLAEDGLVLDSLFAMKELKEAISVG
jgi:orotate phosphoribosyltransferase